MYELSLRKVHGFWANLKYIFFPWIKVVPSVPELDKKLPIRKKYDPSEFYKPRQAMHNTMITLVVVGTMAAAYFAYRYGAF
ncbi:Uncharacterized protein related to deoxyribodip yrimidine photolyase [Comamonas aquatilis]|uniref:hypothetical protein n=1 Tax=Comamonas aquatilis TaxID=1778406 RepID=UPI0039F13F5D